MEPDIAALRAPNMLLADASRPDDGRPLLNDDGLYEPDWVAEYLGIARGTLDNWVSRNRILHTHVGGKLRFVGRALREWLESRTDRPDAEDDEADEEGGFIGKFPWDGKV